MHRVKLLVLAAATVAATISYESLVPKSWNTVAIPTKITGNDLAEASVAHLAEGLAPLDEVLDDLVDGAPDLMVYDSFGYVAGRILAREWGIPSAMTATTFVSSDTFSPYAKLAGSIAPPDLDHPALARYQATLREALDAHGLDDVANDAFAAAPEALTGALP